MVKIFKIGSCRTSLSEHLNKDDFYFVDNHDFTHTTKEVIMYLDIIDGTKALKDIDRISCLMKDVDKFDVEFYKRMIDESDILIIEISSLKIIKSGDLYYQIVRHKVEQRKSKMSDFSIYIQDEADFINDIDEICRRIKKPIIFVPHITLDFSIELESESLIETRQTIEKYVVDNTKYNIKTSDLFSGYHYSEICDCSKKFDPNHYTKLGYKILSKKIEEMCIQISNDNI